MRTTRSRRRFRAAVLTTFGAEGSERDELLAYNDSVFRHGPNLQDIEFPLPDEAFVAAWEGYLSTAEREGVLAVLQRPIVQLNFPICPGISEDRAYRAAVRRGEPVCACARATGLPLNRPECLRLILHPTAAGRIPLIVVPNREDFENIVRAVTRRNEPGLVPHSMGATMVAGFNNWERIHEYKRAWSARTSLNGEFNDWSAEFQRLIPRRALYQDRFIILSEGAYSGVAAEALGLSVEAWNRLSLTIRLNHECTHYFTKRVLGVMRNNLVDEIIADYMGLVGSIGRFRADWFAHFMGLQSHPDYSPGGRLENYRGDPRLCDGAFHVLQSLVKSAAENLQRFDAERGRGIPTLRGQGRLILQLTRMTLEEMAAPKADQRLREVLPFD